MRLMPMLLSVAVIFTLAFGMYKYNNSSFYVYGIGLMHCQSDYSCAHENYHKLDDSLGNVSKSEEFANAIRLYVLANPQSDLAFKIVFFDGIMSYGEQYQTGAERYSHPLQELYASIPAWFDNDINKIPVDLQKFYMKGANQ